MYDLETFVTAYLLKIKYDSAHEIDSITVYLLKIKV